MQLRPLYSASSTNCTKTPPPLLISLSLHLANTCRKRQILANTIFGAASDLQHPALLRDSLPSSLPPVSVEDLGDVFSITQSFTLHLQYTISVLHFPHHNQRPNPSALEMVEEKVLIVGEELWRQTLPLQGGSCLYQLQGLKLHTWYEAKISYPASDENQLLLVTVEPEGFPAKPHVPEQQFIIFNIVCDELFLGIPHKAWWVVALALLCLRVAFIVPSFLPLYLLPRNQVPLSDDCVLKTS